MKRFEIAEVELTYSDNRPWGGSHIVGVPDSWEDFLDSDDIDMLEQHLRHRVAELGRQGFSLVTVLRTRTDDQKSVVERWFLEREIQS